MTFLRSNLHHAPGRYRLFQQESATIRSLTIGLASEASNRRTRQECAKPIQSRFRHGLISAGLIETSFCCLEDNQHMLKQVFLGMTIVGWVSLPAHALSKEEAKRCKNIAEALPAEQAELDARKATLLRLKTEADEAGDAYEEAQKLSAFSDDYKRDAQAKRSEFDRKRAELAELNLKLQEQAADFNNRVSWFNRTCAK